MRHPKFWVALAGSTLMTASVAQADPLSGTVLTIVAQNSQGVKEWNLDFSQFQQSSNDPNEYTYDGGYEFWDNGNLIGSIDTTIRYNLDPIIGITFGVSAGAVDTNFSISSAVLNFPADVYTAQASAGFSLTDFGGAPGALVTGNYPGNQIYRILCNGMVLDDMLTGWPAGPLLTTVNSDGFGPVNIPGAFSMQASFDFTLSAGDLFSGTAVYSKMLVPAPASGLLVGFGGLLIARRRR